MGRAFEVDEANTYVRIHNFDPEFEKVLRSFSFRNLAKWGKVPGDTYGSVKHEITHVFATFSQDKKEYRVIKGFYPRLLNHAKRLGYNVDDIVPNKIPEIVPAPVNYEWFGKELKPRDEDQEEYFEFALRDDKPVVVFNLRTGGGKTALAIMTFVALGYRVVITVLPRYVPVWTKAFAEFLKMKPGDIINVSDYDINELDGLLKNKTINPKVIIFQLTRIDTYIKRMKELPDSIPHLDDFFNTLGGGVRVIDEAHESIYSVYTSLLYGNMMKTLPLSATLRGDDEFINSVYDATFPPEAYLKPPVYDKYIHVISYLHRLNNQKHRINVKGFGGYSHVQYEKGILKSKGAFENYYQVCKKAFVDYYISTYREGQKAMWFFATIAFCKKFEERLRKDYPDLDIFTFTGEVSKKKGMEQEYNNHQIVITTPGSCSTGKDVAKLYIVFACVCISSMQRNDQMNGRTRPIDKWWPDLDPIFLYFTCLDIPKQLEYDRKRRQVLAKKTKRFEVVDSFLWV